MYSKLVSHQICYSKGNATVCNVLENKLNLPPHKNKPKLNIYKAHPSFCTVRADANGIIRYKVNINTQAG